MEETTYRGRGGELFTEREKKSIIRTAFEQAFLKAWLKPEEITGQKRLNVFGGPYVWAIFMKLGIVEAKAGGRFMTKKLIFVILCLCCIGWLSLIFHLSAEDGEKTADTSMRIAEKISGVLYSSPTVEQTAEIHYMVRKAAHVILFFVLGVLSALTGLTVLHFCPAPWVRYVIFAAVFCLLLGVGWMDEWHKQFIEGRHY